jgi:hypothetical protein
MTTTPQEPSSDPELVPSGDQPLAPIETPDPQREDPDDDPAPAGSA